MLRIFCIMLLLALTGTRTLAQTPLIDSLQRELKKHPEPDTTRLFILNELTWEFAYQDLQTALRYGNEAEKLATRIDHSKGYERALSYKGAAYYNFGKFDKAVVLFKKILKRLVKKKDDYRQVDIHNNLAAVYNELGNYSEAVKHLTAARRLAEKTKRTKALASIRQNLAISNIYLKNYSRALSHALASIKIFKTLDDKKGDLANTYNVTAVIYMHLNNIPKSIEYYEKAEKLFKQINRVQDLPGVYSNLSILKTNHQPTDYVKGRWYAEEALKIYHSFNDTVSFSGAYLNICNACVKQFESGKRDIHLMLRARECLDSAQIFGGPEPELLNIYQSKAVVYKHLKQFDSAFYYMQKYAMLRDTIFTNEKNRQIEEINTAYEVDKKDRRNKALVQRTKIQDLEIERGRYLLYMIIAFVLVIVVAAIFFIRQQRIRALQRTIVAEQKLLRSQMNPHFIFNSLTAIESFIYSNQPRQAGRYLSDFARLIRLILENSREEEISLEKEIKTLEYYLIMQQLRMEDLLEYRIEVDPAIDPSQVFVPPMLTQPFIENAIEHGIRPTGKKGLITVSFHLDKKYLRIDVSDNGKGIIAGENKQGNHKSLALEIINERLDALNKMRKYKSFVRVANLNTENTSGTKVTLTLALH